MAATAQPAVNCNDKMSSVLGELEKNRVANVWFGGWSMKRRVGLVGTCVIGAALSGGGWLSTGALAADQMPVKAGPLVQTDAVPYWWFHGTVEAGGRFFLNDPPNGQSAQGGHSLAKYYEYSSIKPGPFSNIWLSTGSSDGLYQIDVWGKNIGYSDQRYNLDFSKAGEQYLNLGWDQTPHVYSTSAQTPYLVNGNVLTLPPCATGKTSTTLATIVACDQQTDIGIKRDTASVDYRWTPSDAWDIKADLSHLRRTGTQVGSLVLGQSSPDTGVTQVPRPTADTTQNYGLNGEYVGTSLWGQKIVVKTGYKGSQYTDDYAAYTVQSPFTTGNATARISLPPSNQANSFNGTVAADLPWKSRYVGTISYTMMRQDAAFIPMSTSAPYALPASSLNGAINTLLSNNVVTTKITPELTSKLSYRYYDFQNNTPEIFFANWFPRDSSSSPPYNYSSLSMGYVKQNAGEELTWRPSREWNLGAAYGYERFDYTRADADATNENSGKLFADWKPTSWLTARSSGMYSNRRYENYDYRNFVANYQFPSGTNAQNPIYQSSYRQLMLDNRQTWKANFAIDLIAFRGLTITPTFKYQDQNYGVNPANQQGLEDSSSWSGGLDATYVVNPDTSIMVGYLREYRTQLMFGTSSSAAVIASTAFQNLTNDRGVVDTGTALVRYAAIPDKLDTEFRYTASRGVDRMNLFLGNGANPSGGQFPDDITWFQRLDATATYKFDPTLVSQLGWKGDVKAKLHYAWERNSVSNWANDGLLPFNLISTTSTWLAWNNPNYNVHMLSASLVASW